MKIFDKRPLSLILCVMLGGFVVFSFFKESFGHIACILALILPILPFIFKQISKYRKTFIILSVALLISMLSSFLYFDCFFKVDEHYDGNVSVSGEVEDIILSTSYSGYVIINAEVSNGEDSSSCNLKADLGIDDIKKLQVGDSISFYATLRAFPEDNSFNSKQYYYSKGINACAENISELKITNNYSSTFSSRLSYLREYVRRSAVMMSDENTGSLLGALLTGEREQLSSRLNLDFKRIGITHILALSGMHLAILSLAVERILKLLKTPKNARIITCMIFCVIYTVFVGSSVSVVRAAIMLIISSFLRLYRNSYDSFTSLCISVFLIVLATPYAVYDIALWLSAFATLGVIIAAERDESRSEEGVLKRILGIFKDSVLASVFANGATLAFSVFSFGGLSLISPISTLIFSFITELFMYVGSIMLFFGVIFFPLSVPFGWLLSLLYDVIAKLAGFLSSFDITYIITNYVFLSVLLIIFTVLFFTLLIVKLNKRLVGIIVTASFLTVLFTAFSFKLFEYTNDELIYSQKEKSDLFLIKSGDETALISSSQYSKSLAYYEISFLSVNNVAILDKYILTHYSYSLEEDLELLLSYILTDEIVVPEPTCEDESNIFKKLSRIAEENEVKIKTAALEEKINIGNFSYRSLFKLEYGKGTPTNASVIEYKSQKQYLYLSSGMMNKKYQGTFSDIIDGAESLIFGSYGKKYSEKIYIDETYESAKNIILSGDSLFLTQDAYRKYEENGCNIISHPPSVELLKVKRD